MMCATCNHTHHVHCFFPLFSLRYMSPSIPRLGTPHYTVTILLELPPPSTFFLETCTLCVHVHAPSLTYHPLLLLYCLPTMSSKPTRRNPVFCDIFPLTCQTLVCTILVPSLFFLTRCLVVNPSLPRPSLFFCACHLQNFFVKTGTRFDTTTAPITTMQTKTLASPTKSGSFQARGA